MLFNLNVRLLNAENQVGDLVTQLFKNRGIEDTESYFKHSWESVQSPYDLDNIEAAADKIIHHMKNSETVAILVDTDMDGYSSAALIYNYFLMQEKHGDFGKLPKIEFIFHDVKEHGLGDVEIMKKLRDIVKPALLIVPDASGTNKQYEALNDIGIEIVVLDHHLMEDKGDGIRTIVVNNQQSKNYKNKSLSGAGVVYQLCRILDDKLTLAIADKYLDLVALGLAADVMDFRSAETRFMIQEGLKKENIHLPFLGIFAKECCYSLTGGYDTDKVKFNYTVVSWNIAPLVNAVNRIGTPEERELLFRAFLDDQAEADYPSGKRGEKDVMVPLAKEAIRIATNAKSRQKRRQDKLTEAIDNVIREDGLLNDKVLVIPIDDFDADQRSLSGLVANKFIDWYKRPCLLLFQDKDKDTYTGSLRAPDNIEAYANFKDQCKASKLVTFAEGHQSAAGIGIKEKDIPAFREYFNQRYADIDTTPTVWVDFFIDAKEDLTELAELLDSMEDYWGQGIKEPLVAITNVPIGPGKITLFKADTNPTLNIKLPSGATCIKFKSSKEEFQSLILPYDEVEQQYLATVVGKLSMNEFNNTRTPQLKIQDYELEEVEYVF